MPPGEAWATDSDGDEAMGDGDATPRAEHKAKGERGSEGDSIDICPECFLWDRGCSITRGDRQYIRTPSGKAYPLHMWNGGNGHLPYIAKEDLNSTLTELGFRLSPLRTSQSVTSGTYEISRAATAREVPTKRKFGIQRLAETPRLIHT